MPRGGFKAARMPQVKSPARAGWSRGNGHNTQQHGAGSHGPSNGNNSQNHANNGQQLAANTSGTTGRGAARAVNPSVTTGSGAFNRGNLTSTGTAVAGRANPLLAGTAGTTGAGASGLYGNGYTYGNGPGARQYRAYGYGSGYRNRYYGRGYGYGRSQGYNRAIVSRLRSAYSQLTRIDHDYQGHRVRDASDFDGDPAAFAPIDGLQRSGFRTRNEQRPGHGYGNGYGPGTGGRRGAGRMPQGQSDARMGHALRTLQGINMQSGGQGGYTGGHARARGHIMRAIHELSVALSIR